jgi:anti-sigma factor RsiW
MNCSQVSKNLSDFVDGALDTAAFEAVQAHLHTCQACCKELQALRSLLSLSSSLSDIAPPSGLTAAIKRAVANESAGAGLCNTYQQMLSAYFDRELSEIEAAAVEQHLAACSNCSDELAAIRATVSSVYLVPTLDPPASLRRRIAATTTRSRSAVFGRVQELITSLLIPRRLGWAAGAAVAAALAFSLFPHGNNAIQNAHFAVKPVPPSVVVKPATEQVAEANGLPPGSTNQEMKLPMERVTFTYKPKTSGTSMSDTPIMNHGSAHTDVKVDSSVGNAASNPPKETAPPAYNWGSTGTKDRIAESPKKVPLEVKQTVIRPPLNKVAAAPVLKHEDMDKFFKDVKAAAQMMRHENNGATMSVVSMRF